MSHNTKSQSALEYLMTYGWAILVIVIVAAVLYSLGIFSPSSSLSTTITGFSNLGTVNAVCLGGTSFTISMGDSIGYPINITQINLTSSSGKTTYSPNILIQPNSIQTVTVPSSLCSPGARYSVSAVISYLESGQILPGPYTSTGTVTGTAASPPSSATSYEPLNITNTQNQGTPSPFQQMINVTSSSPGWGDISSSPFGQNVEFFSSTGQILDSWLENYTSTRAIWWVKLTSSIPAGSKQTIYMGFASTSTNLFNTNDVGEAPQLSSTYAEYDDGANVFNFYNNFAGTTLNSSWTSGTSGGTITVDNGLTETIPYNATTGSYTYISTSAYQITGPAIVESYANLNGFYTTNFRIAPVALTQYNSQAWHADNSENENAGGWVGNAFQRNGIDAETTTSSSYNGFVSSNYITPNSNYDIFGVIYPDNGSFSVSYNSPSVYASTTSLVPAAPLYITISNWLNPSQSIFSTTYPINVKWIRVRAYPPNGVMPSVSFGSVS